MKARIVEHSSTESVQQRNLNQLTQLSLHSEHQPALKLREKELEILPPQPVTKHRHHPSKRPCSTLQSLK